MGGGNGDVLGVLIVARDAIFTNVEGLQLLTNVDR